MSSDSDSSESDIDIPINDFKNLFISNEIKSKSSEGATADDLSLKSLYWRKNEKGITKESRATVQHVLDRRTLYRLSKLASKGAFTNLYGVISTGKEANVYEAIGNNDTKIAVKVYKTSILSFKDRSKYIQGEFRFRRGYMGNKNPRKMVKQWAEKEYRNLRRIIISGIRCPSPVALKDHILVMQQVTHSDYGIASRLHDYIHVNQYIYSQVICIMRYMYQYCKLIHGDLSEYNLLISDYDLVYVIDVSQAVEHDHTEALSLLKRDCINVNNFFKRHSDVNTLSNRLLFHFITEDDDSQLIKNLYKSSYNPNFDLSEIKKHEFDDLNTIEPIVHLLDFYNKMKKPQSNSDDVTEMHERIRTNRCDFNTLVLKLMYWDKPLSDYYNSDDLEGLMLPTQFGGLSADIIESMELPLNDKFSQVMDDNSDIESNYEIEGKQIKPMGEMFTGVIPSHIDRKEWKKMVKELQRQQRMVKIPKHIKRKK